MIRRIGPPVLLVASFLALSCGHKGPPLPPLVRLPAAPGDIVAERRGDLVEVRFVVPAQNTDGSRPANIERVDIYAVTDAAALTDDLFVKHGTRVGSVEVKAPRNPDDTVNPGDPITDVEPLQGPGLDQGAAARIEETITAATLKPTEVGGENSRRAPASRGPLTGPAGPPSTRTYLGVGITTRGRRGPFSRRVAVPLLPPPVTPSTPEITYDETTITVAWAPPSAGVPPQQPSDSGDVLPAKPFGMSIPTITYHVYDVTPRVDPSAKPAQKPETQLTQTPIAETKYVDKRIEWGVERCYTVRVVESFDDLSVLSEAAPAKCTKLTDTFAPAAPKGVTAVASEGAINLIWEANGEKDLAGYIVLRATAPAATLTPITKAPIPGTGFTDAVQAGTRYVYVVQAVDKAGNLSEASSRVEEAAR